MKSHRKQKKDYQRTGQKMPENELVLKSLRALTKLHRDQSFNTRMAINCWILKDPIRPNSARLD